MARRLIWSKRAEDIFNKILQFYIDRNGSKNYSRKLNNQIKKLTLALIKNPFLGKPTSKKSIRILIKGDFKIIYQVNNKEIIILLVWNSRQSPKNIKM